MQEIKISYETTFLNAVFHEAKTRKAKFTVVMCHGFRGSKDGGGRAVRLAEKIVDKCNVLRFDFLPLSTLSSQVSQLNSVLDYCKKNIAGDLFYWDAVWAAQLH